MIDQYWLNTIHQFVLAALAAKITIDSFIYMLDLFRKMIR